MGSNKGRVKGGKKRVEECHLPRGMGSAGLTSSMHLAGPAVGKSTEQRIHFQIVVSIVDLRVRLWEEDLVG